MEKDLFERPIEVNRSGFITIDAEKGKHTHTLIYLHGNGSKPRGRELFEKGGPLNFANLKVVLPFAPRRNYFTHKQPFWINTWFDVHHNDVWREKQASILKVHSFRGQRTPPQGLSVVHEIIYNGIHQEDLQKGSDMQLDLAREEAQRFGGDMSKVLIGGFQDGAIVSLTSLMRQDGF